MSTTHEIEVAIQHLLTENGQLSGSRLSALLRSHFPEWRPAEFGARNLRDFIQNQVTGVIVAGRTGMDVIYALGTTETAPAGIGIEAQSFDFWRLWVSPNSHHVLAVDAHTGEVRATPLRGHLREQEQRLFPPDASAHREIAVAFLRAVPLGGNQVLAQIVQSEDANWWQDWIREVRIAGQLATWNAFRRDRLEKLLSDRLREANLSQAIADRAMQRVRESHAAPTRTPAATSLTPDLADGAQLRRIALGAIERMSISELRDLRLPLGLVVDLVAAAKLR